MRSLFICLLIVFAASGCENKGEAKNTTESVSGTAQSKTDLSSAQAALAQAKEENATLVAYFYSGRSRRRSVDKAIQKAREAGLPNARFIAVEADDPKAQVITQKCGVTRIPFTSVMAPNGAVTARFPGIAGVDQIQRGFVSTAMAELLRVMQDDSVTFLCLTNASTAHAEEVRQVTGQAVERLGGIAEAIYVDPRDPNEISLLNQVKVTPDTEIATTIVVAPSGIIVEKFQGKITQRDLFDSFEKIMTGNGSCGTTTATGGSACDPSAGVGSGHEACN